MSELDNSPEENSFWRFSINIYGRRNVEQACLTFQNSYGLDVNILLYCCWMAVEGADVIKASELSEIIEMVEPWQREIIQPLRYIRTRMKEKEIFKFEKQYLQLRSLIKKCELESEEFEQNILYRESKDKVFDSSMNNSVKVMNARTNIRNYFQIILGHVPNDSDFFLQTISEAISEMYPEL